jgi:hypothetical protein
MKAPNITNYLTNLSREYEDNGLDGFAVVLSDLLPGDSLCVSLMADIGVEDHTEIEGSYIDELDYVDQDYIDDMTNNGGLQVFEAIVLTADDTLVIYLFGKDEATILANLEQRYEALGRGDI